MPYVVVANSRVTEVHRESGAGRVDAPFGVQVGWYQHADSTFHSDPELSAQTIELREAFTLGHQFLDQEARQIQSYRGRVDPAIITLLETEHLHLHEGNYAVAHSSSYTFAQKLAFAQGVPGGASDAANLYELVLYLQQAAALPNIPDHPIFYVNPATGAQLTVLQALSQSEAAALPKPPSNVILDGSWIHRLEAV